MIVCSKNAAWLTYLSNHESVRPYVGGEGFLDCSEVINNGIFLTDKLLCGFFFYKIDENKYDAHSLILPEGRGKYAIKAGKEALRQMFEIYGAKQIIGRTPIDLRHARLYNRLVGLRPVGFADGKEIFHGHR